MFLIVLCYTLYSHVRLYILCNIYFLCYLEEVTPFQLCTHAISHICLNFQTGSQILRSASTIAFCYCFIILQRNCFTGKHFSRNKLFKIIFEVTIKVIDIRETPR